jgi:lipopolysaccharide export system protein LptA
VVFDPVTEDPVQVDLLGSGGTRAMLAADDGMGLTRRLQAEHLVGDFEAGNLKGVHAHRRVELDEYLSSAPLWIMRRACAARAVASFQGSNRLSEVHLVGDVDLHEGDLLARGDQVDADEGTGMVTMVGDPVWVFKDRAELNTPKIVYDRGTGELTAGEGVAAVLRETGAITLGDGEKEDEPIRVQAREAVWTDNPSVGIFRGQVRAWQGENFMLAEEMRGEAENSSLTATGKVKTVWRQSRDDKSDESVPQLSADEPLEVTAAKFVYDRTARRVTYSGGARAVQGKRTLRCTEIKLLLGESSGFEELRCEGSTRIEDAESGNTVTGERAIYLPDVERVRVFGNPVIMRDGKGGVLQGKVLIYDFKAATARLQSSAEEELSAPAGDEQSPGIESKEEGS